jgi:tight adherence protein B
MTALMLVAALAAAGSAAVLPRQVRRAAMSAPDRTPSSGTGQGSRPRSRVLVLVGLGSLIGVGAVGLDATHLVLVAVLAAASVAVVRAVERSRAERRAGQRRQQVVDFCEALVGELRAGQPTLRALERSVEVWPESGVVAATARLGASVPDAMRRVARLPGAGSVRRLAGAWEISAGTGSGLVVAVEQVLATARAEEGTARLVRAELASARATARLVTALPLVVLVAAQGVGARPWHFLLSTPAGVTCLGAGAALAWAGLRWIDHIAVRSAEDGGLR